MQNSSCQAFRKHTTNQKPVSETQKPSPFSVCFREIRFQFTTRSNCYTNACTLVEGKKEREEKFCKCVVLKPGSPQLTFNVPLQVLKRCALIGTTIDTSKSGPISIQRIGLILEKLILVPARNLFSSLLHILSVHILPVLRHSKRC